jgi:hypothetical protein
MTNVSKRGAPFRRGVPFSRHVALTFRQDCRFRASAPKRCLQERKGFQALTTQSRKLAPPGEEIEVHARDDRGGGVVASGIAGSVYRDVESVEEISLLNAAARSERALMVSSSDLMSSSGMSVRPNVHSSLACSCVERIGPSSSLRTKDREYICCVGGFAALTFVPCSFS